MTYIKTNKESAKEVFSNLIRYDELIIILSLPKYEKDQAVKAKYEGKEGDCFKGFDGVIEGRYYDIDFGEWAYEVVCNEDCNIKVVDAEWKLNRWNAEGEK